MKNDRSFEIARYHSRGFVNADYNGDRESRTGTGNVSAIGVGSDSEYFRLNKRFTGREIRTLHEKINTNKKSHKTGRTTNENNKKINGNHALCGFAFLNRKRSLCDRG